MIALRDIFGRSRTASFPDSVGRRQLAAVARNRIQEHKGSRKIPARQMLECSLQELNEVITHDGNVISQMINGFVNMTKGTT